MIHIRIRETYYIKLGKFKKINYNIILRSNHWILIKFFRFYRAQLGLQNKKMFVKIGYVDHWKITKMFFLGIDRFEISISQKNIFVICQ